MQGIAHNIPTERKIEFLRALLACGFHTLDCGSFVNPAVVPQMADTAEVLEAIGPLRGNTQLLVIVGNERGAETAAAVESIGYIGFPFSVNDTFQQRNTKAGRDEAFERLKSIHRIAADAGKETVAYISMAFGNPYGDPYDRDEVVLWANRIAALGIKTISLSDTVGSARVEDVQFLYDHLINRHIGVEFGAHFHSIPGRWMPKIAAAYHAGCRRFDGAILGYGGCPMAADTLTGNIPTEGLLSWLGEKTDTGIDKAAFAKAMAMAPEIYG